MQQNRKTEKEKPGEQLFFVSSMRQKNKLECLFCTHFYGLSSVSNVKKIEKDNLSEQLFFASLMQQLNKLEPLSLKFF